MPVSAMPSMKYLPPLDSEYAVSEEQVARFWRDGFIVLPGVLSDEEVAAYAPVIRDTAMARYRANGMQPGSGGAFLQTLNMRFDNDGMRRFCLSRRFGGIVAALTRSAAVRIYHEQALFKQPGGTDSHWHQDQYYWPVATDRAVGLWTPLVDCTEEMGAMRFVVGSHRYGNLSGTHISDESARFFDDFIAREGLTVYQVPRMKAGDCSFHLAWTVHGAPGNRSQEMREAMVVTYYPDGTRVDELSNPSRVADAEEFLGGRSEGELADSELNTIVFST
ncbi:MAG: phytanoyl-CoA dioxygenase family protein [Spirochaetaceae bacterium]|nr:phytanoyl-CoA dioxygenase family protein [Spirochaetaceae bacterium]